jgi:RNA polymerase sigma factor (sigma-70 family)
VTLVSSTFDDSLPTRASLLLRLQDLDDHSSWMEFFDRYRRFIFGIALRMGLSRQDAEEVVQDTVISVSRGLPSFSYNPTKGSFKGWLMRVTQHKVVDQFRKLGRQVPTDGLPVETTATPEAAVDKPFDAFWEAEWQHNLLQVATDQLRLAVSPRNFQIFDWTVRMGRTAEETAKAFGISTVLVRVTKFRVLHEFKRILRRLEKEPWPKGTRP